MLALQTPAKAACALETPLFVGVGFGSHECGLCIEPTMSPLQPTIPDLKGDCCRCDEQTHRSQFISALVVILQGTRAPGLCILKFTKTPLVGPFC